MFTQIECFYALGFSFNVVTWPLTQYNQQLLLLIKIISLFNVLMFLI